MRRTRTTVVGLATVGLAAAGLITPTSAAQAMTQASVAAPHHGSFAPATKGGRPWRAPWGAQFHITASCNPWKAKIRAGARAWRGLVETKRNGVSVRCQRGWVEGIRGVAGTNYGTLIVLAPGKITSPTLLSAHEFGHIWYYHTFPRACSGWDSPADVMRIVQC